MIVVAWTNVISKNAMNVVRFWIYSEDRADVLADWMRVLEKEKASKMALRFLG